MKKRKTDNVLKDEEKKENKKLEKFQEKTKDKKQGDKKDIKTKKKGTQWKSNNIKPNEIELPNEKNTMSSNRSKKSLSVSTVTQAEKDKELQNKIIKTNKKEGLSPTRTHYLIENASEKSLLLNDISTVEENKLYVKNISENITKEDLHNFFKNAQGYIETRTSYTAKGKIKNFAYIQFDTKENAERFLSNVETVNEDHINSNVEKQYQVSIEADKGNIENKEKDANEEHEEGSQKFKKIVIKNKILLVSISKPNKSVYEPNTVFVKFLDFLKIQNEVITEQIKKFFHSYSFEIKEIRIMGTEESKHAYIDMKNSEDVIKCVEEIKEGEINGHRFSLNYSIPLIKKKNVYDINKFKMKREKEKALKEEHQKEEKNSTIFVSGLNFNTRKHKLLSLFGTIGQIDHINLSKKISKSNIKRNKGFAYITFTNVEDATAALILNGTILDGKSIMVSKYLEGSNNAKEKRTSQMQPEEENMNSHTGKKQFISGNINHKVFKKKDGFVPSYRNKFERNTYYTHEKRRINLCTNTTGVATAPTEKCYNQENNEKESNHPVSSMTNEDFRKLFLK